MANDKISAELIARGLQTRTLGRRVVYYECTGSTNDAARYLADRGEPEGTLVIADEQTAGRGRFGRSWVAPARSSLLMSLILRPDLAPAHVPRVMLAVALGVREAICAETGLPVQIKWHNDLVVRGKKCAGILTEASTAGATLEYVIVGIGVNVNFSVASVRGFLLNATSIADELGRPFPRAPLAQAILHAIEVYYLRLRAGEDLRGDYKHHLATLNQFIRARTTQGTVEGIAVDVDENGALLLQRADGSIVQLFADDVTLSNRELDPDSQEPGGKQ